MSANKNLTQVFGKAFSLTKATRSAAAVQAARASKYFLIVTNEGFAIRQPLDRQMAEQTESHCQY
jgi:hypothetical protein